LTPAVGKKPHADKYRNVMNDWNFDASYMYTALPVSDMADSKYLIFVAEYVKYICVCC
jgi:hypothetical protein